jgi:Arc/MetJ-type ribon-helix-helix transcriptional regulator
MGQSSKSRVNLVVNEERKKRWDRAVEDGTFDSLADLIRTSVKRELDGHHSNQEQATTGQQAGTSEEVLGTLSDIQSTLESLDNRVTQVERESRSSGPDYEFEKVVYELLPVSPDQPDEPLEFEYNEVEEFAVTSTDLATRIGAEKEAVREALDSLYEKTKTVRRIGGALTEKPEYGEGPADGPTYYWKLE